MGMNSKSSRVQAMARDPLPGCNRNVTDAGRQARRLPGTIVAALHGPVCLPW